MKTTQSYQLPLIMNPIRSDKIDATQMAKICQYAINSVIFAGLVIFCYVYMMEDAIAKSNRKGDLGCGVFSQT